MPSFNPFGKATRGVHPPDNKLTASSKIRPAKLPTTVYLPVSQHIGAPAKVVVKRGEEVKTGQVIAEAGGYVSAPIHSTVSGKVTKVGQAIHFISGRPMDVVTIESDGNDEWIELEKAPSAASLSPEEILKRIWDAGIVGMGGATFPTHVKLKPPADKPIDTIILNGAECEPWITSDHRLMMENAREILSGLEIIQRAMPVKNVIIGIEKNKPDAIANMAKVAKKMRLRNVEVVGLQTLYPMGGEKILTEVLLDREVPIGGLPLDIGVVVQNISTAKAIHDAVIEGRPLIERAVTVTGMVKKPGNFMVRFGTTIEELLPNAGGMKPGADELIFGGPMMGITQYSLDTPVMKGTNCLLVKKNTKRAETDCIRCSRCINACPMRLMPTQYVGFTKARMWEECGEYHIDDCIECGSCSYGCPANIPIVQYIKLAKSELGKVRKK